MDTSLKKLSRLELLELMVQLSEDNDYLKAENARLRQAYASRPAVSRAAKIGSIAELAMRTNGFFEAAQRSADDYLREIKRLRDQLAARAAAEGQPVGAGRPQAATAQAPAAVAQAPVAAAQVPGSVVQAQAVAVPMPNPAAQQESEAIIRDAQERAQAILKRANSQAESILAEARAKSEATIEDANRQSRAIVSRANHQADAVITAAHNDANRQAARRQNPGLSAPIRGRHVRAAAEGA